VPVEAPTAHEAPVGWGQVKCSCDLQDFARSDVESVSLQSQHMHALQSPAGMPAGVRNSTATVAQ
jgi:hypothetical protein